MPHTLKTTFVAPEKRITPAMRKRLEDLAPLFHIELNHKRVDGQAHIEISGKGFSEPEPVLLPASEATVRLLAEICSILTRWVPFNVWEPCEVTLFALPSERLQRCAATFRRQIAQAQRQAGCGADCLVKTS